MARKNKSTNLNMNQLDSVLRNTKSSVDKNDTMKWSLRTAVVAYIVLAIPNMSLEQLSVFDNTIFRIFMVLLIVSACVVDKSLALLLAISYMVSLNRLHRLQMSNVQTVSSRPTAIFDDMSNAMPLEQPAQERVPEVEGFQNGGKSENNKFTSGEQLEDCQNNLVGGEENQTNQVQSWKNEMGPQGLSLPIGGANANSLPAPFN